MDRRVVLSEVGRFELEEIEVDAPGEGEMLVRLEASGACHSDLHVVETGVAQAFDDLKAGDVIRSVILF
jgi:Zn-dependent alcohol dehydrogenase